MPVLGIDTSTRAQSVALASAGCVTASTGLDLTSSHSATLVRAIGLVLDAASVRPEGLGAVAVLTGPGSFTGLRIGMATAKGIAMAARIPLGGFSTLRLLGEALAARAAGGFPPLVCALVDAGRGQVYRGIYRPAAASSGPWITEPEGEEIACDPREAVAGLEPGSLVGGDGAIRFRAVLEPLLPRGATIAEETPFLAPFLALRAEALHAGGNLLGAHPLRPNYIRPPDALTKTGS